AVVGVLALAATNSAAPSAPMIHLLDELTVPSMTLTYWASPVPRTPSVSSSASTVTPDPGVMLTLSAMAPFLERVQVVPERLDVQVPESQAVPDHLERERHPGLE